VYYTYLMRATNKRMHIVKQQSQLSCNCSFGMKFIGVMESIDKRKRFDTIPLYSCLVDDDVHLGKKNNSFFPRMKRTICFSSHIHYKSQHCFLNQYFGVQVQTFTFSNKFCVCLCKVALSICV